MSAAGRDARRGAAWITALAAALYLALAARGPGWGDTTDLARRAVEAPLAPFARSYALQSVLVRGVALFVSPAWAATIVSSLAAATGVGVTFWTCRSALRLSTAAAVAAAAVLGLSHTFWSSAVEGEVYALLGTLIASCAACLTRALRDDDSERWTEWLGVGVFAALAVAHHRAALALLPALLYWVLCTVGAARRARAAGGVLVGFIVGLAPLAALAVSAAARQPSSSWRQLVSEIAFGTSTTTRLVLDSARPLGDSLVYVAKWIGFNLPGPALFAAAVGAAAAARVGGPRRGIGFVLTFTCAIALPVRFDLIGDRYVYLVTLYPLGALAAGVGVDALRGRTRRIGQFVGWGCAAAPLLLYLGVGASALPARALPQLSSAAASEFWRPIRRGRDSSAWANETLRALPEGAVLYAEFGAGGALDYARVIGGVRPDVVVVRRAPHRADLESAADTGVWFALTPIWRDDEERLAPLRAHATLVAPSLFQVTRPQ